MDTVAVRAEMLEEIPHGSRMIQEFVCLGFRRTGNTLGKQLMGARLGVHDGGRKYPPGRPFLFAYNHNCWFRLIQGG